jgi:protein-disulfide isomerase
VNQGKLSPPELERYASSLQLDMNRYRADLQSSRTEEVIERDQKEADRLGLTGTPFIFINGREFDLAYFHLEGDLAAWVALEVELTSQKPSAAKAAAP